MGVLQFNVEYPSEPRLTIYVPESEANPSVIVCYQASNAVAVQQLIESGMVGGQPVSAEGKRALLNQMQMQKHIHAYGRIPFKMSKQISRTHISMR